MTLPPDAHWSIAEVERDTGLGKDTLRVWERRYGFPTPERDAQGQRLYTPATVQRLRQIAALLRSGHRPGRVVALDDAARAALLGLAAAGVTNTRRRPPGGAGSPAHAAGAGADTGLAPAPCPPAGADQAAPGDAAGATRAPVATGATGATGSAAAALAAGEATGPAQPPGPGPEAGTASPHAAAFDTALAALTQRDGLGLRRQLQQACARLGLGDFVVDVLAPLTVAVGQGWMTGTLRVADEHLFTEVAHGVLRQALLALPEPVPGEAARVLLTTLPGESHGLGLLMAEAICALEGAACVNLGPQTPLDEIVAAAVAHRAQVVGLSATGALPVRALRQGLQRLRARLPQNTVLWVGGAAAAGLRGLPGVVRMSDLRAVGPALARLTAPA